MPTPKIASSASSTITAPNSSGGNSPPSPSFSSNMSKPSPPPTNASCSQNPTSPAGSANCLNRMSNRSSSVMPVATASSARITTNMTNAMPSRWPVCYASTSSNPSGSPPRINASSSNASPRLMKIPSSDHPASSFSSNPSSNIGGSSPPAPRFIPSQDAWPG